MVVKGFVPSGPAAADGRIRKGDVLVAVDGLDIRKLHTAQVTPLIYGERGTRVVLGFVRPTAGRCCFAGPALVCSHHAVLA
jgi:C-terminal processing protease CtpA/Prc